jgi:hypothetical protein
MTATRVIRVVYLLTTIASGQRGHPAEQAGQRRGPGELVAAPLA